MITALLPYQVFVFGSNLAGIHGAGAALYAKQHFGAHQGISSGPTGQCWAIPTKDAKLFTLPVATIQQYVAAFLRDAYDKRDDQQFLVTPIGCGLAGYAPRQIAPMFRHAPMNVVLPAEFIDVLTSK